VFVCADGASTMMRTKKVLTVYEKGKQKYLHCYCLLHREKIWQRKKSGLRSQSLEAPEPVIFGGAGAAFKIYLEPELFLKFSWSRSRSWWLI